MEGLDFRFVRGGLHFPELGLWLDAHERVGAGELAFVSHAHSDHTAPHARVLATPATRRLMDARIGGRREWLELEFGVRGDGGMLGLRDAGAALTLLPAGHILGSAMALVESGGSSLLYTGDFKLRPSLAAERCDPRPADVLVMETTFGLPRYVFPASEDVAAGMVRFCREAIDNDEVPVLLGYSLGKAQEILAALGAAGLAAMLAEPVVKMTRVYEELGMRFGRHAPLDPSAARGHVVVAPPNGNVAALVQKLGPSRTAMLTGWAMDASARHGRGTDAAFPLSDHAGFDDLVEFVARVRPRRVYTLHGFAAEFAAHLRSLGYDASALSEPDQLELALGREGARRARVPVPPREAPPADPGSRRTVPAADGFGRFAAACTAIRAETGKDRKASLLAGYLEGLPGESVGVVAGWLSGPGVRMGPAGIRDSLCAALGIGPAEFVRVDLRHADAGETAAELAGQRGAAGASLSLDDVARTLERIAASQQPAARRRLLEGLWRRATGEEAGVLARLLSGRMRLGLDGARIDGLLGTRELVVATGTKNAPAPEASGALDGSGEGAG